MRRTLFFGLFFFVYTAFAVNIESGEGQRRYPHSLPHAKTSAEQNLESRTFIPTDPPEAPIRQIAEFEPMTGTMIRYPLGIPYSLVAELAEDDILVTIVSSAYYRQQAINQYTNFGVNLNHCRFMVAPTNSIWTRDYGPFFIFDLSDSMSVVDFQYNRPRPEDDDIPIAYAAFDTLGLYGMSVVQTGGNYMCDGMGVAVSTDLVLDENPDLTESELVQLHHDYLGIETYHILPDPLGEYIKHVDCWAKFLDVDKVMIGQVPAADARYSDFEEIAQYFAEQTSSYGTPYEIFRIYTPATGSPYTPYTNSLILNNKVLVPLSGSEWDDEAIATYEAAMPGYEVIGVTYSGWYDTDALHCRVHEIPDKHMLDVRYIPVHVVQDATSNVQLEAAIHSYSNAALISDSLLVYYRFDDGAYTTTQLYQQGESYVATIPASGTEATVKYYLYAVDESGKRRVLPMAGAGDPFRYQYVTQLVSPRNLTVEVIADTVRIEWEAVLGATSYRVQSSVDEVMWDDVAETSVTQYAMVVDTPVRFYRIVAVCE